MRRILSSNNFKKQYKLMMKRGKDESLLKDVIFDLANDTPLAPARRDHPLTGNFAGFRDCHIEPDWLLIYKKETLTGGERVLKLEATGTHSDLF